MIYAMCYTLFSLILYHAGHDPVYPVLDWSEPEVPLKILAVAVFVGVPVVHIVLFALYTFRKWVSEKVTCCGGDRPLKKNTQPQEMTSCDKEAQRTHKQNAVHPERLDDS